MSTKTIWESDKMNCKKCDFKLVDGQNFCPRCGVAQLKIENSVIGISIDESKELIPSINLKNTVDDMAQKRNKKTVKKVKKGSEVNANDATQNIAVKAKKSRSKTRIYTIYGILTTIVIISAIYLIIVYNLSNQDNIQSVLMAASEDEIFIVEGDILTKLTDVPVVLDARDILTAIDGKSFYLIEDAEYDEDYGDYIGDLVIIKANGKIEDIDNGVVVNSQIIINGLLWYEKVDKDETIVWCFDGIYATEVLQEETLIFWEGTDKVGKLYYTLMDDKDFSTEVFLIENGDSKSIMDDAEIVTLSQDFKKVLLAVAKDGKSVAYIYDGKDAFEVMDDVQDILLDIDTFDMLIIADAEDKVLYYIPYGKDEIELDDDVQQIVKMPNLSSLYFTENIGDMAYYIKDDNLHAADLEGKYTDRLLKNIDELQILHQKSDAKEIQYIDDDKIIMVNFNTFKENKIELPDSNDLMVYDVSAAGYWYVYRTEDNKELFATKGKKDVIELSDDADEIMDFTVIFNGKYVLWETFDGTLKLSAFKEDVADEIGYDVFNYWITYSEEIYYLSDYEDGEGDLYYISKVGKNAVKIGKHIVNVFSLFYDIEIEEAYSKNIKKIFTTVFEIIISPFNDESQTQLQEPIISNTKEFGLKILSPAYGETINNTYTIIKGTADVGESFNKQIEIIIEVINSDGSTYKTQLPFGKNEFEIRLPLIYGENNLKINIKTLKYFDHYLYSKEVIFNNDMNQDFQIICTDEKASEDIINLPYEETTLSEENMGKLDSLIDNYAFHINYDYTYKIPNYFLLASYACVNTKPDNSIDDFDYIYFMKTAVYDELYNSFGLASEEIIKVQEAFAEYLAVDYEHTDGFYRVVLSSGEMGEESRILSVFSYDDYIKAVVELIPEWDWEAEPRYALVILKKSETIYGYNLLIFKRYDTIDLENEEISPVIETAEGRSALYKIKTDGTDKTLIVYGPDYGMTVGKVPEISIIGEWIYYDSASRIFKIKTDGTNRSQLTDYISMPFEVDAAGDWIYFINNSDGNTIYTMKTDGTNQTKITSDDCGDYGYSFSIEGEWIYYSNNSDENSLYKIKTDGTGRTKLNNNFNYIISVVDEWVYYTDSWIAPSLYKIKTDGTNMTKLNDGDFWDVDVVDEWIYYINARDDGALYKMKTDGTGTTKLTSDHNRYINVAGEYVYYINPSDGQSLYKINIDGTNKTKIDSINSSYRFSSILQVVDDWIYYFINQQ